MKPLIIISLIVISIARFSLSAEPTAANDPEEITYVANVENLTDQKVHFTGREWIPNEDGYLLGRGRGHQVTMVPPPAAGDFRVDLEMSLPSGGKKSSVTFGYDGRMILVSGESGMVLEGRFFHAADRPIETTGPVVPAGQQISLTVERTGEKVLIQINGRELYSGPCDPGTLALLGVDPMEGVVRLTTVSARGSFSKEAKEPFDNPFGMQQRLAPTALHEINAPAIVHPGPNNECSVVTRRDGTLEIYFATKPSSDSISVIRSKDGGLNWSEPTVAFPIPGKIYYAVMVTEAADGSLHAVFHIAGEGSGGYKGRLYEVYHTRAAEDGSWLPPRRVIPGYVGAIRGFIELNSGRLVLAAGVAAPDREKKPDSGIDFGWNDTVIFTSDDKGETWTKSSDVLKIPLEGDLPTRYGAVEPALVQLNDGRVWMLIRDRSGSFFESFSDDGSRWTEPRRTSLITSDSPACFVKLRSGKLVLFANACQNWSDPKSYAMGGREVLQAAISDDDGKTWSGFRDVLHETLAPAGGDRGTAYPSAAETQDGKICLVSGQGEGNRAVVLFDPKWLEETSVRDDLASAPVMWAQYGDDGIHVESRDSGSKAVTLPLKSSGLCGAVWNFPAFRKGTISLRLYIPEGTVSGSLCLTDHFNRSDDTKAREHSVFHLPFTTLTHLVQGEWNEITLAWNASEAELKINENTPEKITGLRDSPYGPNYLRIEARSSSKAGNIMVSDLSVTANEM